jgi:Holliday junction resolvase-like predicted endonuclease
MTTTGKVYFLSRPRRFGKSLLVNTMEELFKGNKDLFKGLYIYDKWNWEIKYPVLRLDFGELDYDSSDALRDSLMEFVDEKAKEFNIVLNKKRLSGKFGELIKKLEKKTGQKVVVLIDEYDKAITDFLSEPAKANANRKQLHNFYQVLKATDGSLQFIFLTGISKFSGVSVFSALNNPNDITIDDRYAAICGYTQEELETNFSQYIDDTAKKLNQSKSEVLENIKSWYNGYTWDGKTKVYNPFSTLMLFDKQRFSNYWIKTGISISTEMLLRDYSLLKDLFKQINVKDTFFDGFDLENIGGTSFLFQAGYLTIKEVSFTNNEIEYILEIPNKEVRSALTQYMLSAYSDIKADNLNSIAMDIRKQINNSDSKGLEKSLRLLYAKVPFNLHKDEALYHSIFIIIMNFLGFQVQGEIQTNIGKIDGVLKQNNSTVIIEVKFSNEKPKEVLLDEAIEQIKDKKYYEAYLDKPIILLAIAFSAGENKDRLTEIGCRFDAIKL